MKNAEKALELSRGLRDLVVGMIPGSRDLDLQRLLKQIDADLMDIQHKLSLVIKLSGKSEGSGRQETV